MLYILLNSFASELDPVALYCEFPRVKQTQIIVFSIFSALLLSLLVNVFQFGICLDHRNLFFFSKCLINLLSDFSPKHPTGGLVALHF